ncbi:hypothetical protein RO21_09720 [[Actinobacillus] muris]|uniref:Ion transport domain-containing protein n=2 Tax=Muribacter muris TaxID=67855 RepID=A0A0J5P538_9PAST|nr:ion transporter [Muribacter muris]KMK50810.1 hypothetical protein RO21_09720 [[Actinobacillus] muris] [Muribacter muris]
MITHTKLIQSRKIKLFNKIILFFIVINAIIVGLDTYPLFSQKMGHYFSLINNFCLIIFSLEIIVKIYYLRRKFFKNCWNIFDFGIIFISIIAEFGPLSVFRIIRTIRILRFLSVIPKMRIITQVLFKSLHSMQGVAILLLIVLYIYAVLTTHLYSDIYPEYFGSLTESFYTLFQIMTFDGWSSGIVRPILKIDPFAWIIFISFLLIASYIVLNIAIGIIVDCITEIKEYELHLKIQAKEDKLLEKMGNLENQIRELKDIIEKKHH